MTVEKYLKGVNEIYNEQPSYALGHDGSDGKCDCIGMCKGAIRRGGEVAKGLQGTNYASRYTIKNFHKISSVSQLKVGQVVLKGKQPGESGYKLPESYKPGGSNYNGDLTDYYHIGTVTKINPLEITHMTSPSAKKDISLGNWAYVGNLPQVSGDAPDPPDPPVPPTPEPDKAVVFSENSKPVKMRAKPSTSCNLYWKVQVGTVLDVLQWGDTWSNVKGQTMDGKHSGYMMSSFLKPMDGTLKPTDDKETSDELYTIHIPHLTHDQAQALVAKYPDSFMEKEDYVG